MKNSEQTGIIKRVLVTKDKRTVKQMVSNSTVDGGDENERTEGVQECTVSRTGI